MVSAITVRALSLATALLVSSPFGHTAPQRVLSYLSHHLTEGLEAWLKILSLSNKFGKHGVQ